MTVPDRIFALGGAGKEIALTLLEQEWLLEDILRPRPDPKDLTVTIVDSASGEVNADRQRIQAVRNRVSELENDLRDSEQGRTGDIDVEYKLLNDNIQLNSRVDLLGDSEVPRITAGVGMDADDWWLDDQHINENLDFARGVVRKRGLGKAIYYKAYAEDDDMSSVIDLPEKGKVAMLAGLGGGTGSGLMIDVAHHLRDTQPTAEITLFGVLPNYVEGVDENTNAYAALSELEYLSLSEEGVFKDIMLLPIDPTDFGGKVGDRTRDDLEEFDEAVVYSITSYYHTAEAGLEDPFQFSPDYAPFTIAIPQVLRYNIESINEAREDLREILDKKQQALDAEEQIYQKVDRFLDRHYDRPEEANLRDMDRTDLEERIDRIESLVGLDLFEELEYYSREVYAEIIRSAGEESDSLVDRIEIMEAQARAGASDEMGNYVDDLDEALGEILKTELLLLKRRKDLLQWKKAVDDTQVRNTLEFLMSTSDSDHSAGVMLNRLEQKLEDLEARQESLESELEEAEDELERQLREQEEEIDREVQNWRRDVDQYLDQIQRLEETDIDAKLDELESSLQRYNANIVQAEDEDTVEQVSADPVINALDDVERDLDAVGIDMGDDRDAIEEALTQVRQAKVASLKLGEEESFVDKINPFGGSEDEKEEAHKQYRMVKNQLDNSGVFNVGPPTGDFNSEVVYGTDSVAEEFRRRENDLRANVVSTLQDQLEDPNSQHVQELRSELERGANPDALEDIVRRAFEDEISGTEDVRSRKEEIESELEEVEANAESYESALTLFEDLKAPRQTYSDNVSAFSKLQSEYEEQSRRTVGADDGDYAYVKNVQPNNIFRATGSAGLADADLFSTREEAQRLQANLEELAENARKQPYSGLKRRKLERGNKRYEDIRIRIGVTSPAVEQIDSEYLEFRDVFGGAFNIQPSGGRRIEQDYTTWPGEFGGDWDVALSIFIDGVFLDNIRNVVKADGYRECYLDKERETGRDILIHHSFGLEEGHYVRRKDVLNMEDDEDVDFFLREDEQAISEEILQQYLEVVDVSAPTPLDADAAEEGAWDEVETDR